MSLSRRTPLRDGVREWRNERHDRRVSLAAIEILRFAQDDMPKRFKI
jgi:hypothetical protein